MMWKKQGRNYTRSLKGWLDKARKRNPSTRQEDKDNNSHGFQCSENLSCFAWWLLALSLLYQVFPSINHQPNENLERMYRKKRYRSCNFSVFHPLFANPIPNRCAKELLCWFIGGWFLIVLMDRQTDDGGTWTWVDMLFMLTSRGQEGVRLGLAFIVHCSRV